MLHFVRQEHVADNPCSLMQRMHKAVVLGVHPIPCPSGRTSSVQRLLFQVWKGWWIEEAPNHRGTASLTLMFAVYLFCFCQRTPEQQLEYFPPLLLALWLLSVCLWGC